MGNIIPNQNYFRIVSLDDIWIFLKIVLKYILSIACIGWFYLFILNLEHVEENGNIVNYKQTKRSLNNNKTGLQLIP